MFSSYLLPDFLLYFTPDSFLFILSSHNIFTFPICILLSHFKFCLWFYVHSQENYKNVPVTTAMYVCLFVICQLDRTWKNFHHIRRSTHTTMGNPRYDIITEQYRRQIPTHASHCLQTTLRSLVSFATVKVMLWLNTQTSPRASFDTYGNQHE